MTGFIHESFQPETKVASPAAAPTYVTVLARAQKLVERGWTQGTQRSYGGRYRGASYCAIGAIRAAALEVGEGNRRQQIRKAKRALRRTIGTRFIAPWNDDRRRVQREVVLAFQETIQRELGKSKTT